MPGSWVGLVALLGSSIGIGDSGLLVRAVRFYRADPGQSPGQTQVTAFLRIPAELPRAGQDGQVTLSLTVKVSDSVGGVLYQQAWQRRTALPFPRGEADRLDLIRFTLGAGRYQLEATVTDSVSGQRAETTVPVDGYSEPPAVSDLLISPWLRPVALVDTVPQPGEFRRGGLIVAIAPEVVVGGPAASVAYLLETYAGTATDGRLTISVEDDGGAVRKRFGPTPVRVVAGIGLLTGQLDLGELVPGRYAIKASVEIGGKAVSRMAGFVADPAVATAPAVLSDEQYFSLLTGASLDQAFAPLSAIAEPRDLASWPARGDDEDKRRFLAAFWRRRDPTAASPGNERRVQFYDGVVYTNAFYVDARRRLAGWQTDRGRVFLREGLPTQVLRRQQRGAVPAYEVWRYFEPVNRYYLFVDRGPLGGFQLLRSNDAREARERRWQQILTPTGVEEVVNFLGRSVLEPDP